METINQFDWVDFYKEFANTLLQYKDNRGILIEKVEKIYGLTGIDMPTLERNKHLVDIDPFTIFGLFNKRSMTVDNRNKIISTVANLFDIKAPMPTSFDGVPLLNNQNATYYYFIDERDEDDIDTLWGLYESALMYAKDSSSKNTLTLSQYFDVAINKKGNGTSKITMGLYWIAPTHFLNLDKRNKWYIYESGKMPDDLVNSLPIIGDKISSSIYFEIANKLSAFLDSDQCTFKNFMELSFEAWRYSEEVNYQKRDDERKRKTKAKGAALADDDVETLEANYPEYNKARFLDSVYMDDDSYNTLVSLVKSKKNIILQGASGVGKTFAAKRLVYSMMGVKDPNRVMMVQFHQSYSYEDFIMGFRPSENGFKLKHGVFYEFCKRAEVDSDNDYFFVIDEINRGNLSKIFGELFMLLESDKRGVALQLLYADEKFSIPENLYIIGMMNTADRSLAMLDYALRRRFAFFNLKPAFESDGFKSYQKSINNDKFDKLIECIKQLNLAIKSDESLGSGFCIGHSYFCDLDKFETHEFESSLTRIVDFEIIPLLSEYWFDDADMVNEWSNNLRSAIK
jgi:5-methylcytosine-specific restriction enzyme B